MLFLSLFSQTMDPRPGKCLTPQPTLCPGCLPIRVISTCWLEEILREPRLWNSSIMSRASRKHFFLLLSLSESPQDRACVALAVSFTRSPRHPELLFSSSSADTCSFVARRQRSLWDLVMSWASSAFRFKSMDFVPPSAKPSRAASRRARQLLSFLKTVSRAFHFVLATSLVLLSLCNCPVRFCIEYVTLSVLVLQIGPRIFERSVHTRKAIKGLHGLPI